MRPQRRLCTVTLLIVACLSQYGCLDLLVRAIIDPGGLATDVGAAVAQESAQSMIGAADVRSITQLDQTINRLDGLIAESQNDMQAADLRALRDHIEQSKDLLDGDKATTGEDHMLRRNDPFAYARKARWEAPRRMGEPSFDPAHVPVQTYQRWQQPDMKGVRKNSLRSIPVRADYAGARQHDRGTIDMVSLTPRPEENNEVFAIDVQSGFLRRGLQSPGEVSSPLR